MQNQNRYITAGKRRPLPLIDASRMNLMTQMGVSRNIRYQFRPHQYEYVGLRFRDLRNLKLERALADDLFSAQPPLYLATMQHPYKFVMSLGIARVLPTQDLSSSKRS